MEIDEVMLGASRRLSEALAPGDLDSTLQQITAAAVESLPQVDFASVTLRHTDGRFESIGSTDELASQLDAAQFELQEGPCYDAATVEVHVISSHLERDERFPRYAPVAIARGIHAQASTRLFETSAANAALTFYARRSDSFEDVDSISQLFAHQSAVALAYARQVTQLEQAIRSRQVIGQAVGVAMERFDLDEQAAFDYLARLSQDNNVKLRSVADDLLKQTNEQRDDERALIDSPAPDRARP